MKETKRYEEREGQTYRVTVDYSLGGYSYFSSEKQERGYYLYVQPVSVGRLADGTVYSESYGLFDGYKALLKVVSRQSKKAYEESLIEAEKLVDKLINKLETERVKK